jgi:hypothetical protein
MWRLKYGPLILGIALLAWLCLLVFQSATDLLPTTSFEWKVFHVSYVRYLSIPSTLLAVALLFTMVRLWLKLTAISVCTAYFAVGCIWIDYLRLP